VETVLSVQRCSFAYEDGQFALQEVDIAVRGGEMLGIVGPNGSGKSTLLRLMAGLLKPQGGTITVGHRDLASYRRRSLAREIGFLPQNAAPSFEYTVKEVVALGRYPYQRGLGLLSREDSEAIEQALCETAAYGLKDRLFSTLSGCEKQRVLVASVLAQQPRIMLLDEPSASLDIHHKAAVFDLLWTLSRKGIAVAVVTHDLNIASQFCDSLVLLANGRLVESGAPASVIREGLLSEVYETPVRVVEHPLTGLPMVLVLGKKTRESRQT